MVTERQEWDELVAEFDQEIIFYKPIGERMGKALYKIKMHLRRYELDKPGTGRWSSLLKERNIPNSTAKDWVVQFQKAANIAAEDCFFVSEMTRAKKTRKSPKDWKKLTAVPAVSGAKVVSAAEESEKEKEKEDEKREDESPDKRSAIECIFVLTFRERIQFMEGVRKLGELRSTQAMYRAVVSEAGEL